MSCAICAYLERAYLAELNEYLEARSSASYGMSTVRAAQKNVDMERARYELEEHREVCPALASILRLVSELNKPVTVREVAAQPDGDLLPPLAHAVVAVSLLRLPL